MTFEQGRDLSLKQLTIEIKVRMKLNNTIIKSLCNKESSPALVHHLNELVYLQAAFIKQILRDFTGDQGVW